MVVSEVGVSKSHVLLLVSCAGFCGCSHDPASTSACGCLDEKLGRWACPREPLREEEAGRATGPGPRRAQEEHWREGAGGGEEASRSHWRRGRRRLTRDTRPPRSKRCGRRHGEREAAMTSVRQKSCRRLKKRRKRDREERKLKKEVISGAPCAGSSRRGTADRSGSRARGSLQRTCRWSPC